MAKATTTEKKPAQVPAAELVDDHVNDKDVIKHNNSDANNVSTKVAEETAIDNSLVEGSEIPLGIDLGLGEPSITTRATVKNGLLTFQATTFKLADLMQIIGEAEDGDKVEILKALQSYLGLSDTNVSGEIETKDPASLEREKYRADYPALTRAMEDWKAAGNSGAPDIRITSKIEGFWRAGMQHSIEPVEMPMIKFNPDTLELLLTEPNLTVELI